MAQNETPISKPHLTNSVFVLISVNIFKKEFGYNITVSAVFNYLYFIRTNKFFYLFV